MDRNGRQMIEALKKTRPDVVITVTREEDPYGVWDGDEPLPDGYYACYDHTVTATCIMDGQLIEGTAVMGGSWYDVLDMDADNQSCLREISGYLPQMIDEALEELDSLLGDRPACPACGHTDGAYVPPGSGDALCLHCNSDWPEGWL